VTLKIYLAGLCLLLLFAQMLTASRQLSLTYDEPIYAAVGYADLTTGDMRWHSVIGHPPLVNLLTAWPLLLESTRPQAVLSPAWGTTDSLGFSRGLIAQFDSLERLTLITRLPVMWLTVLLAAFVYRWAQQAWGGTAGLLALLLFTFDPHILAHGQLNTTDMGVTAFGFVSCYALARYLRRPSWITYLGTGLGMGAALASKASGAFWIGAGGLVVLIFWASAGGPRAGLRSLGVWLGRGIGWVGLALFVLWGAYVFELRPLTPTGLPIPAASHWAGLAYIRSYMATGQTTFIAGRLKPGGHWSYFPLALLIKTPLPTLLGLLTALIWSMRHRTAPRWSTIPLVSVPVAYVLISMSAALNIGHRHMLPVLPFAFVFIAQLAGEHVVDLLRRPRRRWWRALAYLLAIWYIGGTLTIFPNYLTFFNILAGGPDGGYRYLADSSVDWGQALKELQRYLDRQGYTSVHLAAFSSLEPCPCKVCGYSTPIPTTGSATVYRKLKLATLSSSIK